MAKAKGAPKSGGRKRGVPNKAAAPVAQLRHALPALGWNVAEEFLQLYRESDVVTRHKLFALYMQYSQVIPTANDVKEEITPITADDVTTDNLLALVIK